MGTIPEWLAEGINTTGAKGIRSIETLEDSTDGVSYGDRK